MTLFRVGEIVWAKIKGYPKWPATVLDPSEALEMKPPKRKNMYHVHFLDAGDKSLSAWVSSGDMDEFESALPEMMKVAASKGGKTYSDLKKCIGVGEEAHQAYRQLLLEKPEMAVLYGMASVGEGSSEPTSKTEKSAVKVPKSASKKTAVVTAVPEPGSSSTSATKLPKFKVMPPRKEAVEKPSPRARTAAASAKKLAAAPAPSKKRPANEDSSPAKVNGSKKVKGPIMTASGKKEAGKKAAAPAAKEKSQTLTNGKKSIAPENAALKRLQAISVGLVGLDDARTVYVARQLLTKDVSVRVWAQDNLAKDLEYSRAERVTEAEKLFEESDVVFVSAANGHELQTFFGGDGHTIRKIRAAAKGKVKGVCVFGTLTQQESAEISRQLQPKNLLYLECAWIGSKEHAEAGQLGLISCGDKRLFEHCKPLLDAICGGRASFVSQQLGRVQVIKAAMAIADGIALAGFVEAAYFAQQNGVDLATLSPFLAGFGFGSDVTEQKVQQILDFGRLSKDTTKSIFKDQYTSVRDAVTLAHPTSSKPPSLTSTTTPLASMVMDAYKTEFIIYRYERDQEQEAHTFIGREKEVMGQVKAEEAGGGGAGQAGDVEMKVDGAVPVDDTTFDVVDDGLVGDGSDILENVGLKSKEPPVAPPATFSVAAIASASAPENAKKVNGNSTNGVSSDAHADNVDDEEEEEDGDEDEEVNEGSEEQDDEEDGPEEESTATEGDSSAAADQLKISG